MFSCYYETMKTKSGKDLFPIGIGTWKISGEFTLNPSEKYNGAKPVYGKEKSDIDALHYSMSKGQNHFDCAELYGAFYTDEVVGRAIKDSVREDLFLADKLWKCSVGKDLVRPTVEKMLKKLGTNYLDMLYIHAPWDDAPWIEAIPQIDDLIEEGIVRHFGVSNFTVEQMRETMAISKNGISANQMNYNVLHKNEVNQTFHDFCVENNIVIVAYQPIKRQEVISNDIIQEIAKTNSSTAAQVALAWLLSKNTLPIPKATQKAHIDENVGAANIKLSPEDISRLDRI
jgi:diketogulonate reductase-like aldo/keto reductase